MGGSQETMAPPRPRVYQIHRKRWNARRHRYDVIEPSKFAVDSGKEFSDGTIKLRVLAPTVDLTPRWKTGPSVPSKMPARRRPRRYTKSYGKGKKTIRVSGKKKLQVPGRDKLRVSGTRKWSTSKRKTDEK